MYEQSEVLSLTNNTLHNEHLKVKLFGPKGLLHDMPAPSATEKNEEMMERQERQKSEVVLLACLIFARFKINNLVCIFMILFFKILFKFSSGGVVGGATRVMGEYT